MTYDLSLWLVGKSMVDFLFALIELIRYLLLFWSYEAKCVQFGCFYSGRPICTQILPGQGCPPSTILGIRKLETQVHPTVKTTFFCVPSFSTQYRSVTDGRISHSICSALWRYCRKFQFLSIGRTNVTDEDMTDGFTIAKTQT